MGIKTKLKMRPGQLLVAAAAYHYNADISGVEEFIAGMIEGMIQKDDLPELQKCLKNTDVVATQVENIVNEIAKGDLPDVIKAVEDALALIQALPTDLEECENIQDDVQKIKAWGENFITPSGAEKIIANVMANWSKIQANIGTIVTDMQSQKEMEAGLLAADTVILALGRINYMLKDKDIDWELVNAHNTGYILSKYAPPF